MCHVIPLSSHTKTKARQGRSSTENGNVSLAVEVEQVDEPRTLSPGFCLFRALIRPVGGAVRGTASVGRFKGVRDVELLERNVAECKLSNARETNHRDCDGEIANRCTDGIVAEEGRMAKRAKHQGEEGSSETKHKTEKRNFHVVVAFIFGRHLDVVLVGGVEVRDKTIARSQITDCVEDKDGNDKEGKHFIRESGGVLENSVEIEEGSHDEIYSNPDTNPSIEGQERNTKGFRQLKANRLEGKDGSSTSVDAHWHTTNEGIDNTIPASRQHQLNGSHVVLGTPSIHGSEGNGRGNRCNVDEELKSKRVE